MNGVNPNVNNDTNNELTGISLGSLGNQVSNNSVETIESLGDIPSSQNLIQPQVNPSVNETQASVGQASLNQTPVSPTVNSMSNLGGNEPKAIPIPGTENIDVPSGSSKKFQNIGKVPEEKKKDKKPMNKAVFIILIIALIAGVAFGLYYFLNMSNSKVKLTTKTLTIGVGDTLPDSISSYATISKGDTSACSLNTRSVDVSTLGEYQVTITCGKDVYTGKVVVADTKAPELTLNVLYKTVGDSLVAEEFVKTCTDPNSCQTSLVNEESVKSNLATAGAYEVEVQAVDDAGNSTTEKTMLYVSEKQIFIFTLFTSQEEVLSELKAKKTVIDALAFDSELNFLGIARRNYRYVFTNEEEYQSVVNGKSSTITFDNVTGFAEYDDSNLTLEISTDLSVNTLNSENNGVFPVSFNDVQTLYNAKNYLFQFVGFDAYINGEE